MLMSAIIGHRGARGLAAENTLDAITMAASLGVRWVELDVRLTRDQVPILFHDAYLNKLSKGRGELAKQDYKSLKDVLVRAPVNKKSACAQPLADLASALSLAADLGLGVNLEIKPAHSSKEYLIIQRVEQVVRQYPGLPLVISSFSFGVLKEAQQLLPQLPRACLWEHLPRNWQEQAFKLEARSVHLSATWLKRSHVAAIRAQGKEVYVYTVNSTTQAEQLFSWGVTGIFTDYPQLFEHKLNQPVAPCKPFGSAI